MIVSQAFWANPITVLLSWRPSGQQIQAMRSILKFRMCLHAGSLSQTIPIVFREAPPLTPSDSSRPAVSNPHDLCILIRSTSRFRFWQQSDSGNSGRGMIRVIRGECRFGKFGNMEDSEHCQLSREFVPQRIQCRFIWGTARSER